MRVLREALVFYFVVNVQHELWPLAPILLPAQPAGVVYLVAGKCTLLVAALPMLPVEVHHCSLVQ
jgi:hypothetical protein